MIKCAIESRTGLFHQSFGSPAEPLEGSQPRLNEKTIINMIPSQNVGMETPNKEKEVTTTSCFEYCFLADIIPTGIDIPKATTIEIS
jgi:hypothetical protein